MVALPLALGSLSLSLFFFPGLSCSRASPPGRSRPGTHTSEGGSGQWGQDSPQRGSPGCWLSCPTSPSFHLWAEGQCQMPQLLRMPACSPPPPGASLALIRTSPHPSGASLPLRRSHLQLNQIPPVLPHPLPLSTLLGILSIGA